MACSQAFSAGREQQLGTLQAREGDLRPEATNLVRPIERSGEVSRSGLGRLRVLTHFAEAICPEVRPVRDAATQELAMLVARRRQLMQTRVLSKIDFS